MNRGRIVASLLGAVLMSAACEAGAIQSTSAAPSAILAVPTQVATLAPTSTPTGATVTTPTPAATAKPTPRPTNAPGLTPAPVALDRWSRVKTQAAFAMAGMSAVAASASRYVAVGWAGTSPDLHGAAWTSPDGLTWRRVSVPGAARAALAGVVHDRIGFIAWGYELNDRGINRGVAWTSPDGLTWRRAPDIPASEWAQIVGIARLGATLVAVGRYSPNDKWFVAWTSVDGRHWQRVTRTQLGESPAGLASSGKVLIAWTHSANLIRSTDGLHWRIVTRPASRGLIEDVAGSSARFVAVGYASTTAELGDPSPPTRAWTSTDGRTWRPSVLRPPSVGGLELVVRHGPEWVTLGDVIGREFSYRSADGRTLTKMSSAPDTAREGRTSETCVDGPCPMSTIVLGLANAPHGVVAVGRTELQSGAFRAVVWVLR